MVSVTWSSARCAASTSSHVHDEDRTSMRSHSAETTSLQHTERPVKSELTSSPDFRLLSLSPALSRPTPAPVSASKAAIQSYIDNFTSNTDSRNVSHVVNNPAFLSSPATASEAYAHFLGPSVPASCSPHVLNHRRQRPRTSNQVIFSSHGSNIAPGSIPKNLPPVPSISPRRSSEPEPEQEQESLFDFESVKANYINMLNQNADNTAAPAMAPENTVCPADLQAPIADGVYQDFVEMLRQGSVTIVLAPSLRPQRVSTSGMPPPTPDLYTSPAFTDFGDLTTSPDTPLLDTPVVGEDDMLTGMFEDDGSALFPPMDYDYPPYQSAEKQPSLTRLEDLIALTPESPVLHDFNTSAVNPSSIYPCTLVPPVPSFPSSSPVAAPAPLPAAPGLRPVRKSAATGTRKGVTPAALVPIDAPTQPRKYLTPSATSRKDVPSVFANKKRSRSIAFGHDDDEEVLEPPGPNASERELIEYKRRQNTVAARRSRKRKLEHQQYLEQRIRTLESDNVRWKERTAFCVEMLRANGISPPLFVDEDDEDEEQQ